MKTKEKLELRMYSLTLYQLSGTIHAGIQPYHATIEAFVNFGKRYSIDEKQFKDWAKNWKTVIILNGGTTTTLGNHYDTLIDNGIKCNKFHEPDLGNILTAISFIVDERVFNKTKYPDYDIESSPTHKYPLVIHHDNTDEKHYKEWLKSIGGKENEFLRTFLSKFKKA